MLFKDRIAHGVISLSSCMHLKLLVNSTKSVLSSLLHMEEGSGGILLCSTILLGVRNLNFSMNFSSRFFKQLLFRTFFFSSLNLIHKSEISLRLVIDPYKIPTILLLIWRSIIEVLIQCVNLPLASPFIDIVLNFLISEHRLHRVRRWGYLVQS